MIGLFIKEPLLSMPYFGILDKRRLFILIFLIAASVYNSLKAFCEKFVACKFFCIILRFRMFDLHHCFAVASGLPSIFLFNFSMLSSINPTPDEMCTNF